MKDYTLAHLSDPVLLSNTDALIHRDRQTTADLLAHLAEVDDRKLYLGAAFPSMYAGCGHKMQLTEDAALKRIQAARTARKYPAIFPALAEGRLHLSAVCLLAPHLATANSEELLQGAAFKTKVEIELFLAGRFPRTELMPLVEAVPGTRRVSDDAIALTQVGAATEQFRQPAPGHVKNANDFAKVVPTACQRFALYFSIGQGTHDKLRYAQELFSHQLRPGDLEAMFELALDQLICVGEKRKFAATSRPQRVARKSVNSRHIPNRVKREVWKRDGGQCTFVGESGHRCESRTLVEYDHVEAVARGGMATVSGIRLRCRAHNQFTAEQTFGREFMANKREAARRATEQARAAAQPHDVANGLPRRDGRREPPCWSAANHNPRYRIFSATLFPCRNNSR